MRRSLMNLIFSCLLAGAAVAPNADAQTPTMGSAMGPTMAPGSAAVGKTLYDENCASCHLASGAGGVHFGGGSVSADLRAPGLERTYRGSDALILRAILHARDQDDAPLDKPMPAWAGRLSAAQAKDIIAYLHTLHGA